MANPWEQYKEADTQTVEDKPAVSTAEPWNNFKSEQPVINKDKVIADISTFDDKSQSPEEADFNATVLNRLYFPDYDPNGDFYFDDDKSRTPVENVKKIKEVINTLPNEDMPWYNKVIPNTLGFLGSMLPGDMGEELYEKGIEPITMHQEQMDKRKRLEEHVQALERGKKGKDSTGQEFITPRYLTPKAKRIQELMRLRNIDFDSARTRAEIENAEIESRTKLRNAYFYEAQNSETMSLAEGGINQGIVEPLWTLYETGMNTYMRTIRGGGQVVLYPALWMGDKEAEKAWEILNNPSLEERAITKSRETRKEFIGKSVSPSDPVIKHLAIFADTIKEESANLALNLALIQGVTGSPIGQAGGNPDTIIYKTFAMKTGMQGLTMGTYGMFTTPGTIAEKSKAGVVRASYIMTPIGAGYFGGMLRAHGVTEGVNKTATVFVDILQNMSITHFTGDNYYDLARDGFQRAVDEGNPRLGWMYATSNITPALMGDTIFSLNTRPVSFKTPYMKEKYYAQVKADTNNRLAQLEEKTSAGDKLDYSDTLFKTIADESRDAEGNISGELMHTNTTKFLTTLQKTDEIVLNASADNFIYTNDIGKMFFESDAKIVPFEDMENMNPYDRMKASLVRLREGEIIPEKFLSEIDKYTKDTDDISIRNDIEKITGQRLEKLDQRGLDKLDLYFDDQFMKYNFPEEYAMEKIQEKIKEDGSFSYTIQREDTPELDGTIKTEWYVRPNQRVEREVFFNMKNLAEEFGGKYEQQDFEFIGGYKFDSFEKAEVFSQRISNVFQNSMEKVYPNNVKTEATIDPKTKEVTYEVKPAKPQKTIDTGTNVETKEFNGQTVPAKVTMPDYKVKPTEEAAIVKPKAPPPVQSKERVLGVPIEVKIPPRVELDIPKLPKLPSEGLADLKESNALMWTQKFWESVDKTVKSSQERADAIKKFLVGNYRKDLEVDKLNEYVILAQSHDKYERALAEDIFKNLNSQSQNFVDRAREFFGDTGIFESVYNRRNLDTGKKFNKVRSNYWHRQKAEERMPGDDSKVIEAENKPEASFWSMLKDPSFTERRKAKLPSDIFERDAIGTLEKYVDERQMYLDGDKTALQVEEFFAQNFVKDEILRQSDLGKHLLDQAKLIHDKFAEFGLKINVLTPTLKELKTRFMQPEVMKAIADDTPEGRAYVEEAEKYRKLVEGMGDELGIVTDREKVQYMIDMDKEMSKDNRLVPWLHGNDIAETVAKGIQGGIDLGQGFQRMDNRNVFARGEYGPNRKLFYDSEESVQKQIEAVQKSYNSLTELGDKYNIEWNETTEGNVGSIFAETKSMDLMQKTTAEIHKSMGGKVSLAEVSIAQTMARDMYKMNEYLKTGMKRMNRNDYTPTERHTMKSDSVFDKYMGLVHKYTREKELGTFVRDVRIIADNMEAKGFTQEAHYWRTFLDMGLIGNQGKLDKALRVGDMRKTVNVPLDKMKAPGFMFPTIEAYERRLMLEGYSKGATQLKMAEMEAQGKIKGNRVLVPKEVEVSAVSMMRNLQQARVYTRLVQNLGWTAKTQPLSYGLTAMRNGLINSFIKAPYRRLFDKEAVQEFSKNAGYKLKRGEKGKIPSEGAEMRQEIETFRKTTVEKLKGHMGLIANWTEKELDMLTMLSADLKAQKYGLEGKDKKIFLSDEIARTQSKYDREARATILNNDVFKTFIPHRAYAITLMNNFAEYAGYQQMPFKERAAFGLRGFALLTSMGMLSRYTMMQMLNSDDDSTEEGMWNFANNILSRNGQTVSEQYYNFILGADPFDLAKYPKAGLDSYFTGHTSVKWDNNKPLQSISRLAPGDMPGLSMMGAIERYAKTGNIDHLRKEMIGYVGFLGVGGGAQASKITDTILGQIYGEVQQGKQHIEFGGLGDDINGMLFGKTNTPSVIKEWNKGKKENTFESYFKQKYGKKNNKYKWWKD